jgi:hypothetical protein
MTQIGQQLISFLPSPDPTTTGYRLYVGRASGLYDEPGLPLDIGNVTSYTYPITSPGAWFFAAAAYNSVGLVGGFSVELTGNFDWPENPRQQHRGLASMGGRRTSSGLIR